VRFKRKDILDSFDVFRAPSSQVEERDTTRRRQLIESFLTISFVTSIAKKLIAVVKRTYPSNNNPTAIASRHDA
jgi:hypothetical protein